MKEIFGEGGEVEFPVFMSLIRSRSIDFEYCRELFEKPSFAESFIGKSQAYKHLVGSYVERPWHSALDATRLIAIDLYAFENDEEPDVFCLPHPSVLDEQGLYICRLPILTKLAREGRIFSFDRCIAVQLGLDTGQVIPFLAAPAIFSNSLRKPIVTIITHNAEMTRQLHGIKMIVSAELTDFELVYIDANKPHHWLEAKLRSSTYHIHLGRPPSHVMCGRLIDSAAAGSAIVLLDTGELGSRESNESQTPPPFVTEKHMMEVSTLRSLKVAIRDLQNDAALRQTLTANATKISVEHNRSAYRALYNYYLGVR